MSIPAEQPANSPTGQRGQVAAAIAASIDQIPNVARSTSLMLATLYPGGRIEGIVLSPQLVSVHIMVDSSRFGDDLLSIGESVARTAAHALRTMGDARPVAVQIDDLLPIPVPVPQPDTVR